MEVIDKINVAIAAEEYQKVYGANKNLYRIQPRLQDGLRPGKGRAFYMWWLTEKRPQNTKPETLNRLRQFKVNKLASDTMTIHPHSDDSDVIATEGQPWANNVLTIDAEGSFGNIAGDKPAAGRYIIAKLAPYMIDCFFDHFDDYCVPMRPAYDNQMLEPEFLPAKYPHILFNGSMAGIGYGLASNIPPFNVGEVLKATVKLIKDPNAKIMLVPDSPTGCDIIDTGTFREINETGVTKFAMRAKCEVDYVANTIRFTNIPLMKNVKAIIEQIVNLKCSDIKKIEDSSKEGVSDFLIILDKDANPDKYVKKLYKKTDLRAGYSCKISFVDDFEQVVCGVKELLLRWIEYRRSMIRSMLNKKIQKIVGDLQEVEVLLMVTKGANSEKTIKFIRTLKRSEAVEALMKEYSISSVQARAIIDMKIGDLAADSHEKYAERKLKLIEERDKIISIMEDENADEAIDNIMIEQLEDGCKKYSRPRQSSIIKEEDDNAIPDTNHLLAITSEGYVKKVGVENASIGKIGDKPATISVMPVNNRNDIIVVDESGSVVKIPVSSIPDSDINDIGIETGKFFKTHGKIINFIKAPSLDIFKSKDDMYSILFITEKGIAKRVQISEFKNITSPKSCITLADGDKLAVASFILDKNLKDVIVCTASGFGARMKLSDIKTSKKQAKGSQVVNVPDGDKVVTASLIDGKNKKLFYITSLGRGKITELRYFPQMEKKAELIPLITTTNREHLVTIKSVNTKDVVRVFRKCGEAQDIKVSDIPVSTRISKPEKIVKTGTGDSVVAVKVLD